MATRNVNPALWQLWRVRSGYALTDYTECPAPQALNLIQDPVDNARVVYEVDGGRPELFQYGKG